MEPGQGLDTAPGRDTGTVVKWDDGRGFGFIKPETGGDVSDSPLPLPFLQSNFRSRRDFFNFF